MTSRHPDADLVNEEIEKALERASGIRRELRQTDPEYSARDLKFCFEGRPEAAAGHFFSFADAFWRVLGLGPGGVSSWSDTWVVTTASGVGLPSGSLLREIELSKAYPNPTNGSIRLGLGVPEASDVSLDVFDVLGRRVFSLKPGLVPAGRSELSIPTDGLAAGTYWLRIWIGKQ